MKNILCYGDSNTFGYEPITGKRYSETIRYPKVLQELLGEEFYIVEEGCNGRTTIFANNKEPWKSGEYYLKPCLNSHKPLDVVIIMLGTNDMKIEFHATPEEVALGMVKLVDIILEFTKEKQNDQPSIVIVSPPYIGEDMSMSSFSNNFDENSIEKSYKLANLYREIAQEKGCFFYDSAKDIEVSKKDSLHLLPSGHLVLAKELAKIIKKL